MKFEIEFHSHGIKRDSFLVKARESGIIGCFHNGIAYQPDKNQCAMGIRPAYLAKAVSRAQWLDFGISDTLRLDLWRKRDGAPIGTLFARFIAE